MKPLLAVLGLFLLFGCDEPPETKTYKGPDGHTYTLTKDDDGCDKAIDVERDDGKKGRITIKWDEYVPGAAFVLISIGFAVFVARRQQL